MTLTSDTALEVTSGLAIADLGGEAVLLDPTTGRYFGLNEVAARILELAQERTTVAEVVDRLIEEFDVDRAQLEADVVVFARDMAQRKLLVVEQPTDDG